MHGGHGWKSLIQQVRSDAASDWRGETQSASVALPPASEAPVVPTAIPFADTVEPSNETVQREEAVQLANESGARAPDAALVSLSDVAVSDVGYNVSAPAAGETRGAAEEATAQRMVPAAEPTVPAVAESDTTVQPSKTEGARDASLAHTGMPI